MMPTAITVLVKRGSASAICDSASMPARAAIVTGASRGIGLALASLLAEEGYGVTMTARKPELLERSANSLREKGLEVDYVAGNLADDESVRDIVTRHREAFGRLDVLINNAGVGIGAAVDEHQTKHVDLQLAVNLRAIVLFYRESAELLRAAGVKSVAFCPGFVDTDMSDFVKGSIPAEQMLRTSDIAEALRFVLRVSPNCVIPEIVFQ